MTDSTGISILCLALSFFFLEFVIGPAWAVPMDVSGQFSGTVTGTMVMAGARIYAQTRGDSMLTRPHASAVVRNLSFALVGCAALFAVQFVAPRAVQAQAGPQAAATPPERMVTQGPGKAVSENLYRCPIVVDNHRSSFVGEISADDGTVIVLPTVTAIQQGLGPEGSDLYNECTQVTPENTAGVSTANVPVIEVDNDGEVITGYIVADNYYELYVNGMLVSVDNTPYTPFNSTIVKFRARRPYTLAFLGVDWDEHLGIGMELFPLGPQSDRSGGNPWYPGDGGLIARFSDGTVTDSNWKAQSFYIAPLNSPDEVVENGMLHDTTPLGRIYPAATKPDCQENCYAVHYPIPAGWQSATFDDSAWPRAYEYTDTDVGTRALPGYARYPELFAGSRWIWSLNLVFDNVVIARRTVR